MIKWKRYWDDPSEALPVDVMPCSNGEYFPPPPTSNQLAIMRLADEETERWRRRFGMKRRDFVRTSAALAIGFWAIDVIAGGTFGRYASGHNTETTDACDLENDDKTGLGTLQNLEGEFIFDVQSHHIDPQGLWRVDNPAFHAVFAVLWPQSSAVLGDQPEVRPDGTIRGGGAGEVDPIENLSRFHYLKELFLDSATSMTVLSAVPTAPDIQQPLPIAEAATTVHTVNDLAKTQRTVMHAFVMPNRGSAGHTQAGSGRRPVFLDEELALMTERAKLYRGFLRGWKTYPAWGDIPYTSGWFFDDEEIGAPFIEHVLKVSQQFPEIPPVIATHKGFALPGFDQRAAAPREMGIVGKQYPGVRWIVYHSGHDIGDDQGPYPGDDKVSSSDRTVNSLIKSLRENKWDAGSHIEKGKTFGNSPNVWAELGSVWRDVMHDPDQAAHLLGKLINHVGPKRIAWGTDSLWYGSPHAEIVALRRFEFTEQGKALYRLPYGLEGDREDPTKKAAHPSRSIRNAIFGYNAAEAYNIDPFAQRNAISCDEVNGIRGTYVTDPLTERERAPLASNEALGARSRRELLLSLKGKPWGP